MRARYILLIVFALVSRAFCDGLPYSGSCHLVGEWLIINVTEQQLEEISTRRTLNLNERQRTSLARMFKDIPDQLEIVSSTFNDNVGVRSDYEIHSVWLRAGMVGITFNSHAAAREGDEYWEKTVFTSVASPDRIIMSIDAKLYRDGKELSVQDVYGIIDQMAEEAADKRPELPAIAYLGISVPPEVYWAVVPKDAYERLLHAFAVYGETKRVQVGRTW